MSISCASIILLSSTAALPGVRFSSALTTGIFAETNQLAVAISGQKTTIFNDTLELKQLALTSVTVAQAGYIKTFIDTTGNLQTIDETGLMVYAGVFLSKIPKYNYANFSLTGLQRYIDGISFCNNPLTLTYTTNPSWVNSVNATYQGGVYAPTLNRIYLVPFGEALYTLWHYIDCATNEIESYWATDDGIDPGTINNPYGYQNGYFGGAYDPVMNRIYFAPYRTQDIWQYVDCNTGFVDIITGATIADGAYRGAVYSPKQQRIYFIPYNQATQSVWHYIDCATATVVAYTHGATGMVAGAYSGGSYEPGGDRIYFGISGQFDQAVWHYINCATGAVVSYSNPSSSTYTYPYVVYSPLQNRLYFIPLVLYNQELIYLDCYSYQFTLFVPTIPDNISYLNSGVGYSPVHNFIFAFPDYNSPVTDDWIYIDCKDGTVGKYYTGGFTLNSPEVTAGLFSPISNAFYLCPKYVNNVFNSYQFIYITDIDSKYVTVSNIFMSGALYNHS